MFEGEERAIKKDLEGPRKRETKTRRYPEAEEVQR